VVLDLFMKIGIDARIQRHGIGRYTRELVIALSKLDSSNEYVIYINKNSIFTKLCLPDNFSLRKLRVSPYTVWEQFILPYYIYKDGIDVFHATSYLIPIMCPCPMVVTIHDLCLKVNPNWYSFGGFKRFLAKIYYEFMNTFAINKAKQIITVSNFAKKEILEFYPNIPEKKINVIYNAVSHKFSPAPLEQVKAVKKKYGLNKYVLFVGTFNPIKNLLSVINAFSKCKYLLDKGYKLVIVARKDSRFSEPEALVNKLNINNYVIFADYLEEESLIPLYSGADMLVVPSFHESFGLPVVEAFACHVPVITSNTTGLVEIAREAAVMVSPDNIEEIKDAMLKVAMDRGLQRKLISKGLFKIRNLSWELSARKTIEVYKLAISHLKNEPI